MKKIQIKRLWGSLQIHRPLLGSPGHGPMYRLNPSPLSHRPSRLIRNMYEILENSKIHNLSISCQLDLFDKVFKSILLNNSEIRTQLFKILDKVVHWITTYPVDS